MRLYFKKLNVQLLNVISTNLCVVQVLRDTSLRANFTMRAQIINFFSHDH